MELELQSHRVRERDKSDNIYKHGDLDILLSYLTSLSRLYIA